MGNTAIGQKQGKLSCIISQIGNFWKCPDVWEPSPRVAASFYISIGSHLCENFYGYTHTEDFWIAILTVVKLISHLWNTTVFLLYNQVLKTGGDALYGN